MTGTRRRRDSTAPSLFPFLAVLLCTMGALVVILMLVVSGAQASAKHVAEESRNRTEDAESQIELAKSSYQRQLQEGQIDLEKKRLALQHFEQHILELMTELEDLESTAKLLAEETTHDEKTQVEKDEEISALEKQLAEAAKKLKQKLDKPEGDKPIFAIIPYEGSNGTHRRPIYLECTESGVTIQPLGIKVSAQDLQPPYGPGNPLDAALRTIRAEYAPKNGAVTRTAYPLLVVRPSGIRSYSLARAAMSGWDDQFGYELIAEELELAFPETEPGLSQKVVKTLELARERQAALVLAMPRRYKQFSGDFSQSSSDGSQYGDSQSGDSGTYGSSSGKASGTGAQARTGSATGRGGYAIGRDADSGASDSSSVGVDNPPSLAGFGAGDTSSRISANGASAAGSDSSYFGPGSLDQAMAVGGDPYATSSNPANRANGQSASIFNPASGAPSEAGGAPGSNSTAAPSGESFRSSSANNGTGSEGSGSSGSNGGGGSQSNQSNQIAMPMGAGRGAGSSESSNAGQSAGAANSAAPSSSSDSDPNSASQSMPQFSLNSDLSQSKKSSKSESSQPVASQRGRNWAWSQGPPTQTSVVRSIHLHCFADRCVLVPDKGNPDKGIVISFDQSPQERAEQLARAVHDRVDSWGMALSNGYWKPVLVVDVAPDAAWRFDQLSRLLEGSGLEISRRGDKPPNSK